MHPVASILIAMLCGAPATIVAFVLLPWSIAIGIYGFAEEPMLAVLNWFLVLSAVIALTSYWILAATTLKGRRYPFDWKFGLSLISALFCFGAVIDAFPALASLFVIGPIFVATVYFVRKQRSINSKQNDV